MDETVYAAFRAAVARAPDAAFLCVPPQAGRAWYPDGTEWSYAAVAERVEGLRVRYAAAGYGHGHRVALLTGNRPEFVWHYLALNALGVSAVPVNPDYRRDELAYQMEHSEVDLAVVASDRIEDMAAATADRVTRLPIVALEPFPADLPSPQPIPRSSAPGGDTEACLLYTSGTTGRPKGCIITNYAVLENGRAYAAHGGLLSVPEGEIRLLNPLPLYHTNCLCSALTMVILTCNCLILPERFSPTRWWPDVKATRANAVHYLGVVPPLLMNQPKTAEETGHGIRFGFGAGVDPELHAPFEARFGFPLVEVWGMTETGRTLANGHEPRQVDTRAFGRSHAGMEARIVDDQDREVARGTDGELVVRHPGADPRSGFFSGYLKNPEATVEAWRGGWFHTGDICRMDATGMIYFVDRRKNIIRRSGENIAAAEVEAVLQVHPAVAQVAVLAVPDEIRDEEVMACIVVAPGETGDAALASSLSEWCLERIAYYKVPGWILFVPTLPTTGTQKVQKGQIFPPGTDPRHLSGVADLRDRKKRGR